MADKTIKLAGQEIGYTLKTTARAKTLRLAVHLGGRLVVTKPQGLAQELVERFMAQKAKWILAKLDYFKRVKPHPWPKATLASYRQNRQAAEHLVQARASHFSQLLGFNFNKIIIRNQKSRWGSCSKKGNLNFNYKLVFLPQNLSDYVIAHEVCHLKEFNHSSRFWSLVAKVIPNYKESRQSLKG